MSIYLGTIISYHVSVQINQTSRGLVFWQPEILRNLAAGCPGWILGKCAVGRCSRVRAPSFRLHVQLRPKQPLQLRPKREFWCVSPPKFGGDIGVSPGVQEGLMLILWRTKTFMYHYLIRLLKKLNVFWDGFNLVWNFHPSFWCFVDELKPPPATLCLD